MNGENLENLGKILKATSLRHEKQKKKVPMTDARQKVDEELTT